MQKPVKLWRTGAAGPTPQQRPATTSRSGVANPTWRKPVRMWAQPAPRSFPVSSLQVMPIGTGVPVASRTAELPPTIVREAPWYGQRQPPVGELEVQKAHRKKRRLPQEFDSRKEKAGVLIDQEFEALVPLMPRCVKAAMLGGEHGLAQVPDPERQARQVKRILVKRAGADGHRIADVRLALGKMRAYAQVVMKVELGGEDAALFLDGKVSSALAHDMVAWRSDDALARAAGSQQGRTAGHGFGQDLTFMGDRLGWPIDTSRIDSAAPPPTALPRKKAGTMPLDARVQVEHVAAGGISAAQWAALGHELATKYIVEFYARSLLSGALDQSLRLGEGIRVELFLDEEDPGHVMRGHAYLAKDGQPIDLYAPSEGVLGRYVWYADHLDEVL